MKHHLNTLSIVAIFCLLFFPTALIIFATPFITSENNITATFILLPPEPKCQLKVIPTDIDFGSIARGERAEQTMRLVNVGNQDIDGLSIAGYDWINPDGEAQYHSIITSIDGDFPGLEITRTARSIPVHSYPLEAPSDGQTEGESIDVIFTIDPKLRDAIGNETTGNEIILNNDYAGRLDQSIRIIAYC